MNGFFVEMDLLLSGLPVSFPIFFSIIFSFFLSIVISSPAKNYLDLLFFRFAFVNKLYFISLSHWLDGYHVCGGVFLPARGIPSLCYFVFHSVALCHLNSPKC